jgi:Nif-specific regulatory protein
MISRVFYQNGFDPIMNIPIEQSRSRLNGLIDLSQSLMNTFEVEALIDVILNHAVSLFSAEACSIALIDPEEDQLTFTFSAGKAAIGVFRIKLGEGIVSWVVQSGQGVICNDTSTDKRFFKGVDQKSGYKTRNLLCTPLRQSGMVVGAIEVLNTHEPRGFVQEDLDLLYALGSLAGAAIARAKTYTAAYNTNLVLNEAAEHQYRFVGDRSPKIRAVLDMANAAAPTRSSILILGESGTGKEIIARKIHAWSPRANAPFVAINCGAITLELVGSELFGHEKGAFTGANAQRKGKFELANGGSLFLDEIGDLPADSQAMLLRVLQEKEFQRVGGSANIRTDVRIIAATNRDLKRAIQEKTFREDLYYRLNVVSLVIPSLRERPEDIPLLIDHFTHRFCREVNRPTLQIEASAIELLESYAWPGNVRELQNVIERAVVLSPPGSNITEESFPPEIRESPFGTALEPLSNSGPIPKMVEGMNQFKKDLLRRALEKTGGNQTEAAKLLGLQRTYLARMIRTLGLR